VWTFYALATAIGFVLRELVSQATRTNAELWSRQAKLEVRIEELEKRLVGKDAEIAKRDVVIVELQLEVNIERAVNGKPVKYFADTLGVPPPPAAAAAATSSPPPTH
jgi:uncharacterized coiled-coil protein SlyX